MDIFANLPPAVLLVLALLLVVWLVLLLLVPFMIESIRGWSRRSYLELVEINKKLDRLTAQLAERTPAAPLPVVTLEVPERRPEAPRSAAREPREQPRVRKEPTIS